MHINSQHHNLLGSQISPKSEDFCIWWPFCTLVTMEIVLNPPFFVSMTTAAKFVQPIPIFYFGLSRSNRCGFIRHISRRLLNGNQWNFTGMLSTMSRCADYFRNFQNGRCCHGNGQNAKKLKKTKIIMAGYSPNRNWWNLIGTTSTNFTWHMIFLQGFIKFDQGISEK
jgi:hypothetical protein